MLLLLVQVNGNLGHQADDNARGNVLGEQFLVILIYQRTRNRQGLAHRTIYRILCRGIFSALAQEHRWRQLDFLHIHYSTQYVNCGRIVYR